MPSPAETSNGSQDSPVGVARPGPRPFGIWRQELDERTSVIAVEGELDLSTAPRLKWMLMDALQAEHTRVVVDLARTTFMDSTALGVLVAFKRGLTHHTGFAIACPPGDVLQIFEFAGMDGAFALFPALDDALASLRGDATRTD